MKTQKILGWLLALAAALPAVEVKNSVTVELLNGHLASWETRWQEGSLPEVRLWGKENGLTSGSLAVGPFLVGPLKAQQRSGRLWHFVPSSSAAPGTWGAFAGLETPVSAWFLQSPERVEAGGQVLLSWSHANLGAGWQRSWPGTRDEARFLVEARTEGLSAVLQTTVVGLPVVAPVWGADLRFHAKAKFADASLRWTNEPGESGDIEVKARWGAVKGAVVVPVDCPEPLTGNAGLELPLGATVLAANTSKNSDGWVQELSLGGKASRGTWQLEGSWPWGEGDWSLSPQVSVRTEENSRWSLKITWKGPVGQEPGAALAAQWQGGGWQATLGLEAPHLDAQWFGTANQTTLTVKRVF